MRRGRREHGGRPVAERRARALVVHHGGPDTATVVALAMAGVVSVAAAVATRDPVRACGAAAVLAVAVATYRSRRGQAPLSGQLVLVALATAVLVLARAGLPGDEGDGLAWEPLVAVLAYPLLARALLNVLADYRRVRATDLVVEAALLGVAASSALWAVFGEPSGVPARWSAAATVVTVVLVGLDVVLVVLGARLLTPARLRLRSFALLDAAVATLLGAHAAAAAAMVAGRPVGPLPTVLAAAGLLGVGAAALHPSARREVEAPTTEPPPFSPFHAAVVVLAVLVGPAVLAAQVVRDVTVSPTVVTGVALGGAVLAAYLVGLLQERGVKEHQATHDALTGLPNRTLFGDRLERAIAHARRGGQAVGVLFVDLDRFKDVNDTFGHHAGDALLRTVATRLLACRREEDTVARLGGDEFALLLPHLRDPGDVMLVAQRVLGSLGEPVAVAEERLIVGASVGVAVFPDDGDSWTEVLASADAAMYRAKDGGGGSCEVYSPRLATKAHARLRLEAALYAGMERNELVLHYQPIVDLATGRTAGAEALVRWDHPERGLLLPGHFVPAAEQSDLIVLLGERVILDACRELRRWEDLGITDRTIAVNVSSRHFNHGLDSTIAAALRATGADPARLVVELTESTAVEKIDLVAACLEGLRELGVRSAIDDFGTGYCGLRYLGTLPVDCLKIDKSFIQGMTPSAEAIVAATIAMGHSLGLTIVAEGVETAEQRTLLARHGCDRVQGFLFGRPMDPLAIVDRLRAEGPLAVEAAVPPVAGPVRSAVTTVR